MSSRFSLFLDRLAERFAVLLAGSISSRVEGLNATVQADQQSQLEDLARKYEADGKTAIAATLRERAAQMVSPDLAGEAVKVTERLTAEPTTPPLSSTGGLRLDRALPDFSNVSASGTKKRRKVGLDTLDSSLATGVEP